MRGYVASLTPWRLAVLQTLLWVAWMTGWDAVEFHDGLLGALIAALIGGAVVLPGTWYGFRRNEVKTSWIIGQLPLSNGGPSLRPRPPAGRRLTPACVPPPRRSPATTFSAMCSRAPSLSSRIP